MRDKISANNVIHVSTNSYEWYTSPRIIEIARKVLGGIDLDPASCEVANEVVGAAEYFTKDDNSLTRKWRGRVWLNPPYNMPLIAQFADKAISEYENGNVGSALVLTNNSTETNWYQKLAQYPHCITLGRLRGRLAFWNGDKKLDVRQGQVIFYLGHNPDLFHVNFSEIGLILKRY